MTKLQGHFGNFLLLNSSIIKKEDRIKQIQSLLGHNWTYTHAYELLSFFQHEDDRVRFWVLDTLIKDHQEALKNQAEMIPLLVPFLSDASGPVVDRAVWAINCTGSGAVPYLLEQIETADIPLKQGLFWAISKNFEVEEYLEETLTILMSYMEHAQLAWVTFNCIFTLIEEKAKRNLPLPVDLVHIRKQARPNLEKVLNYLRDEYWKARYRRVFGEEN